MSVDELRNSRDLAKVNTEKLIDRLMLAVQGPNERQVKRYLEDMQAQFARFNHAHLLYVTKSKTSLTDPENASVFDPLAAKALTSADAADEYAERRRDEELLASQDRRKRTLKEDFTQEIDMITTHLGDMVRRMKLEGEEAWKPDPPVLTAELVYCEKKFDAAKKMMLEAVELESSDTAAQDMKQTCRQAEMTFRRTLMEAKSYGWGPGGGSATPSPNSSLRSGEDAEKFKNKKLDYPHFDGDVRDYLTFKRDFEEIVKKGGRYTPHEMSHIMRTYCLQGRLVKEFKNIVDFDTLESQLDDQFLDKERIVDIITRQLDDHKAIKWNDYQAFIDLVSLVEKGNLDLKAIDNEEIMCNPMTVRLIEKKCPDWVQKPLVAAKREANIPKGEEFSFLLSFLVEKRKEARSLLRLTDSQQADPQKVQPAPTAKKKPFGNVNAAAGTGQGAGAQQPAGSTSGQNRWKCIVQGCTFNKKHFLSECRTFKRLDANGKGALAVSKTLCVLCFGSSHDVSTCPKKTLGWKECDVAGCGRWHSRMLHGAVVPGLVLTVVGSASNNSPVLLLCQRIPTDGGVPCLTFWDHGSTTALVTFSFAAKAALKGVDCVFELTGVGERKESFPTKLYVIPLLDKEGNRHEICAFGIDKITSDMEVDNVGAVARLFSQVREEDIDPPSGSVDLLIGMSYVHLLPVQQEVVGQLAIYSSQFGTGMLLGGQHEELEFRASRDPFAHSISHLGGRSVKPLDFITAEGLGIDIPRKCKSCQGCRECDFEVRSLSWKEQQELQEIEKGLDLDTVARKWTATYPMERDPSELRNNFNQALSCMASLEKRLKRTGQLEEFNLQFQDTVQRGVFRELTEMELDQYTGPVNHITIVETYKPGPHSTSPIRLCMNSSMKFAGVSLNDLLMKGPSALSDIFGVTLSFRKHRVGFVKDLSKFYQSVLACERDQHLRRVLWRDGDESRAPSVYVTTTVNFGDKPAGCVAQTAVRETARLYRHIDEEAAELILTSTFCDDTLGGGENQEAAVKVSNHMDQIVAMGGFKYKDTVMSGDRRPEDTEKRKVLGLCWDEEKDTLSVDIKVNVSQKKKGVRVEPNIDLEQVRKMLPQQITKRIVWRIVLGQYDLLGLVCVFMIRLKLVMRDLSTEEGRKLTWDEPISDKTRESFLEILEQMDQVREISFPRCVRPPREDQESKPIMLCFGDGSTSAFCTLVYGRWKLTDGSYSCRLISGKTRVAPLRKISVPRLELLGAVASVRLAQQVQQFLGLEFSKRYFFTDSSAILGMIRSESAVFQEFVGVRVSEIRSKSEPDTEWYWLPTDKNLADLGTRNNVTPVDMVHDSHYQVGMEWMRSEEKDWPINQSFAKPPEEEYRKAERIHAVQSQESFIQYGRFSSYSQLQRVMAYVFLFLESIRRSMISGFLSDVGRSIPICGSGESGKGLPSAAEQVGRAPEDTSDGPLTGPVVTLTQRVLDQADSFLISQAQMGIHKGVKEGKYDSLQPQILEKKDGRGFDVKVVVVSGRLKENLRVGYDKTELPLIERSHPIARLIMREAHEVDHSGLDRSVMRSRNHAWIIQARSLAKVIKANCFRCRLRSKILARQIMAPLPQSRLPPAPVFHSTAVDLFGPLLIRDTVKGRVRKKCWGVLFCCTVTSAIHLEVSEDYSCGSFLLCLRRFINLRGTPARFQSDPGDQILAAAAEMGSWDFSQLTKWAAGQKTEWHRAPAGSQHFNGTAESMIRVTKLQLTDLLKNRVCTKGELDTLMSDVMFLVNSRPLMLKAGSDPWSGGPITPLHLIGGRATMGIPSLGVDVKPALTKRLRFLEETKQQFWKKWFHQVFPHLVPCYKWKKEFRDVMEGDVVLLRESNVLQELYKLARVKKAIKGEDGHVRRVLLEYRSPGQGQPQDQGKLKETERSIHNVVVIVPVDWKAEDVEQAVVDGMHREL